MLYQPLAEEWRPIPGHPRHEANSHGRVRSIGGGLGRAKRPRMSKLTRRYRPSGHLSHLAAKMGDGVGRAVHRLVLLSFVGLPPYETEGCHNDGNPENNHICNLRWDTRTGNMQDKVLHGTSKIGRRWGELNHNATITDAQVAEIRANPPKWGGRKAMAEQYGIARETLNRIIRGDTRVKPEAKP